MIHDSVLWRIRSRMCKYDPRAIPMKFREAITGRDDTPSAIDLGNGESAFDRADPYIKARCHAQYLLYIVTALFVGYVLIHGANSTPDVAEFLKKVFTPNHIREIYDEITLPMSFLISVFVVLIFASFWLRLKIGSKCKEFWDEHR